MIWTAEPKETKDGPSLKLTHVSPDGEENYPGTVTATATYTLTNDNELKVEMTATTDKTTLVNMAHHTYWNLAGGGTILDHELTIPRRHRTRPATPMVPDGTIKPVKGTPFDFTKAKPIGKDLKAAGGKPVGYDHNWIVNGDPHAMRLMAKLKDPKSGRVLTIAADQPGLQFYSGNFMDGKNSRQGRHARAVRRPLPRVAEVPELHQRPRLEGRGHPQARPDVQAHDGSQVHDRVARAARRHLGTRAARSTKSKAGRT